MSQRHDQTNDYCENHIRQAHRTGYPHEAFMQGPEDAVGHEDCEICAPAANVYAHGVHGVDAAGCPNCGGEVIGDVAHTLDMVVCQRRCLNCQPDIPVLGAIRRRLADRIWRWRAS